jgi:hypothetical protein
MLRLLLLIAIIVVVALVVRRLLKSLRGPSDSDATPPADKTADVSQEAKLVRCVECGAFVPKAEALAVPNGFRCGAGCASR